MSTSLRTSGGAGGGSHHGRKCPPRAHPPLSSCGSNRNIRQYPRPHRPRLDPLLSPCLHQRRMDSSLTGRGVEHGGGHRRGHRFSSRSPSFVGGAAAGLNNGTGGSTSLRTSSGAGGGSHHGRKCPPRAHPPLFSCVALIVISVNTPVPTVPVRIHSHLHVYVSAERTAP